MSECKSFWLAPRLCDLIWKVRLISLLLQISTGFASWQRYCTASSSGHQPNFAALNRDATYIREGDHHVGHWLTFLVYTYLCRPLEMILSEIVSYSSGTYDLLQHTQDNTGPHTKTVWSHVRSLNFVTIWFATLKLRQLSVFGDLAFGDLWYLTPSLRININETPQIWHKWTMTVLTVY